MIFGPGERNNTVESVDFWKEPINTRQSMTKTVCGNLGSFTSTYICPECAHETRIDLVGSGKPQREERPKEAVGVVCDAEFDLGDKADIFFWVRKVLVKTLLRRKCFFFLWCVGRLASPC